MRLSVSLDSAIMLLLSDISLTLLSSFELTMLDWLLESVALFVMGMFLIAIVLGLMGLFVPEGLFAGSMNAEFLRAFPIRGPPTDEVAPSALLERF